MGYADGFYYGQGRIICDTSTFSVGDTIRVRSMTDSSKVWNQQVATVGTALVFTVPCYDYYKICTVQDIGGVATEIGGVYKTVDYGQTLFINVLDKTTLGGIQGILNAHQENDLLAIGDEVTITVNGSDWVMQVAGINLYDTHEVIFASKYLHSKITWGQNTSDYKASALIAELDGFYSSMAENLYLKDTLLPYWTSAQATITTKIWVPSTCEGNNYQPTVGSIPQHQYPLFTTANNRIKTYNSQATEWWTRDYGWTGYSNAYLNTFDTSGASHSQPYNTLLGVLPCFRLTADS